MERAPRPSHGRLELDSCEHGAANPAAVRELRDRGAVGQKLLLRGAQRPEPPASAQQRQPEGTAPELHADVAAVDEPQLEQAAPPRAADGERTRIESPHDPTLDADVDHDADPHPDTDVVHPERPGREERERCVIPRRGPPRGCRDDMESRLRAGREPEPPRA